MVARDFRVKGDHRQFEPPLEMKRMLFRMAMVDEEGQGRISKDPVKLMFIDIKKAHLNGKVRDDQYEYVSLKEEAGGGVVRLRRWLYGMRQAASAWEEDYAEKLKMNDYERGLAAPTAFVNKKNGVRLVVWGDDFTFLGQGSALKEAAVRAVLGPEPDDDKEVRSAGSGTGSCMRPTRSTSTR